MNECQPFGAEGPAGVADALQKVDCLATDATEMSFGRLFGAHGNFQTALSIILTLYIALLAFNLLTGRSALRISVLTPKMMTLGLVLTFATSWIAYQSVVWNLATGAPDEIASVVVGTRGSATDAFAGQLDVFFNAITDAAEISHPNVPAVAPNAHAIPPTASMTSPTTILSIAALIMLLGTVGVLVVCRIALAALLIIGPVFIVLALFEGTRGLFEGWLKSVAMLAIVPLLTVLMGSGALAAIGPMVAGLDQQGGAVSFRSAVSILVASIIYASLMLLVTKVAVNLTRDWRIGQASASLPSQDVGTFNSTHSGRAVAGAFAAQASPPIAVSSDRVRSAVASLETMSLASRVAAPAAASLPMPTVVPHPVSAAASDSRRQLRYLQHRISGASNPISREMMR